MKNGLYTLRIEMLDGVSGVNTGVVVLRDGSMLGGDTYFYYVGSYSFAGGRWKGELLNREHTPTYGERPLFGRRDVGIGFSGNYTDDGAEADAMALAGKTSIRFKATLWLLGDVTLHPETFAAVRSLFAVLGRFASSDQNNGDLWSDL